ncbi:uncharacterized protein LOC122123896 [Dipodomys spectabilis]|uniref:uncharacterized protein LOC122123896 n=1 Tax=Dipodomys spectabilis TaxID=105255 RepID=UPI001C5403DC|nr:uncharacterized protein LOC122123896 [Dipodomys spectabilis]
MLQVWARGPLGEILSFTTTSTWTLPKVWAAWTLGSRMPLLTSTRNEGAQGRWLPNNQLVAELRVCFYVAARCLRRLPPGFIQETRFLQTSSKDSHLPRDSAAQCLLWKETTFCPFTPNVDGPLPAGSSQRESAPHFMIIERLECKARSWMASRPRPVPALPRQLAHLEEVISASAEVTSGSDVATPFSHWSHLPDPGHTFPRPYPR